MTYPDHDALRDLLGAYALNAVDEGERASMDEHLSSCSECRAEVDRHLSVAAQLAVADVSVPAELWDRVRSNISPEVSRLPVRDSHRRPFRPVFSAAAIAVLIALVSIQTVRLGGVESELAVGREKLAAIELAFASGQYDVLASIAESTTGSRTVAMTGDGGNGRVTILPDGTGFLTLAELLPLDDAHTYQLWAVIEGEVISAGVLGSSRSVTPFHVDADLLEGLVLTKESAGGVAVSEQPAAAAWFAET